MAVLTTWSGQRPDAGGEATDRSTAEILGAVMGAGAPVPDRATHAYRESYRAAIAGPGYNGWRHGAIVLAAGGGLLASLVLLAPSASVLQWVVVMASTLVIANFVEYWAHRGPMHRPTRVLRPLFERHARRHHRYFARGQLSISSHRDLHVVLFPPVLFGFFAAIAMALGVLIALSWSRSVAFGFVICCVIYYLAYEVLHLYYHLPGSERVPLLGYLARHHRQHHRSRGAKLRNFNLVFPLFDWVHGTLDREARL